MNPFLKFLQSARNLAKNQDLSKEDVLKFAKNEFGDITGLMRAQIDQIFKPGKQAITKQTDNIVSIKKDDIPKKAEGGIMRANYARGTDLEAGAQPITIEGDVRPNNMMMASESPEEELEMLRDIELLQEMKEFEEFKKNNPGSTYDDFKASKLISKKEISDLDLILKIMEIEGDDFGSATQKMQMYRRMEDNKKNKPKDPGKKVRKIKLLAQGGLSSLLGE